ncbi:MAG: CheR family methyltransferase [Opitutales bacterium]
MSSVAAKSSAPQTHDLSDREYEYFRSIIYDHCRINLGPNKRELVKARLNKRLRALKLPNFKAYIDLLQGPNSEEEWTNLIDSISTNYTFFFREPAHFEFLYKQALPELASGGGTFRVWSSACSSGEEPYSVSIVLDQFFKGQSEAYRIECTDISTRILAKAREGIFAPPQVEKIRRDWMKKYFEQGRRGNEVLFRIKEPVRGRLNFTHMNLMDRSFPWREPFQVVFCRNVMIYFDRETQEDLVQRIAQHIVPGGYLFIGHSESLTGVRHGLKLIKPSIYKKV